MRKRTAGGLAVDQSMQEIQHVRFGRHALSQSQFNRNQHSLFVMMQDQRQDIDHLAITARPS